MINKKKGAVFFSPSMVCFPTFFYNIGHNS